MTPLDPDLKLALRLGEALLAAVAIFAVWTRVDSPRARHFAFHWLDRDAACDRCARAVRLQLERENHRRMVRELRARTIARAVVAPGGRP